MTGSCLITRLRFFYIQSINLSNFNAISVFLGSFPEPEVELPKLGTAIFTFLFCYCIYTHSVFLGVADFYISCTKVHFFNFLFILSVDFEPLILTFFVDFLKTFIKFFFEFFRNFLSFWLYELRYLQYF